MRWFDEGCMSPADAPSQEDGATATDVLQAVPVIRGWSPEKNHWDTVGTGTARDLVQAHIPSIDLDRSVEEQWEQWDKLLSAENDKGVLTHKLPGYVQYVRAASFSWFECPGCGIEI
jgi:hypothetical protein